MVRIRGGLSLFETGSFQKSYFWSSIARCNAIFVAMLARSCCRCVGRARMQPRPHRLSAMRAQQRNYSASAASAPTHGVSKIGALAPFASELDKLAPSIDLRGEQIQILKTPAEFYETLKVRMDFGGGNLAF
jgi:CDP-diacylglycerol--glycerol-3-phosphate 3-phosphatidyltransferase